MSKRLQIVIAAIVATISGALSQIANTPPELQSQLPQLFPEKYRGIIGVLLKIIMGAAAGYATWAAHNPDAAKSLTIISPISDPIPPITTGSVFPPPTSTQPIPQPPKMP